MGTWLFCLWVLVIMVLKDIDSPDLIGSKERAASVENAQWSSCIRLILILSEK